MHVFWNNPLVKKLTVLFIVVLFLVQLEPISCKPIGGEPPAEAILLADQRIKDFLAGEISYYEMSQQSNKLGSVENESSDPIAISPDDLNVVNAAKVQSWQTAQAAKELLEAQAKEEKEHEAKAKAK